MNRRVKGGMWEGASKSAGYRQRRPGAGLLGPLCSVFSTSTRNTDRTRLDSSTLQPERRKPPDGPPRIQANWTQLELIGPKKEFFFVFSCFVETNGRAAAAGRNRESQTLLTKIKLNQTKTRYFFNPPGRGRPGNAIQQFNHLANLPLGFPRFSPI